LSHKEHKDLERRQADAPYFVACFNSSNSGTNAPPAPPRPGARL
jgi:hypothetical protein